MAEMKDWVDTAARRGNVWLVLVFHGIDGVGWEPKTGAELAEYFGYIKSLEGRLWVTTFRDAVKYMRERARARVTTLRRGGRIEVDLRHDLPGVIYDLPLTLRAGVPPSWRSVEVKQAGRTGIVDPVRAEGGASVVYRAVPNAGPVTLARHGR